MTGPRARTLEIANAVRREGRQIQDVAERYGVTRGTVERAIKAAEEWDRKRDQRKPSVKYMTALDTSELRELASAPVEHATVAALVDASIRWKYGTDRHLKQYLTTSFVRSDHHRHLSVILRALADHLDADVVTVPHEGVVR
jgi:transposase